MLNTPLKKQWPRFIVLIVPITFLLILAFLPMLFPTPTASTTTTFVSTERYEAADTVILKGYFKESLPEHQTLWLYAENAQITLSIGDQRFSYNGLENTPAPFHSPGSSWSSVDTSALKGDALIEIRIHSYYNESPQATEALLSHLYIGDGAGLYQRMLQQIDFFTLILFCALISGIIYTVEGVIGIIFGASSDGIRISIFGFYCTTGSFWCIMDAFYPYYSLFLSPSFVGVLLDGLGLLLFTISLSVMMCYNMRHRQTQKVMRGVVALESLTAAVCLFLQFSGYADLVQQQIGIGIIALISLGIATACVIMELRQYHDRYLLLLLFTVLPVFVVIVIDALNFLWPFIPRRVMMQYGFGLSMLLMISQLISYAQSKNTQAENLRKIKKELEHSRVAIMLSQIQPHFLYNSLTGIKQLCDIDPQRASDALEHFAYYLRSNLDSLVNEHTISFNREMEHVQNYLYLEKMRFPKKIKLKIDLGFQDFMLPPLTLQSIVENAVRYGLFKKRKGGTLTIISERMDTLAVIIVKDDGVGFDPEEKKLSDRTHIGIENVRSRLKSQCGGSLFIESEKNVGTTVKIIIPLPQRQAVDKNKVFIKT